MSASLDRLWPRGLSAWVAVILGSLSVLKLIDYGFDYGFSPALELMLGYYETFIHALLGWWAEPIIRALLEIVGNYVGFDLDLYPHWKHVFMILSIYSSRRTANLRSSGGSRRNAIFLAVWGLPVALASGIVAGVVPIRANTPWANFLIATVPILGVTIYDWSFRAWLAVWDFQPYWASSRSKFMADQLLTHLFRAAVGVSIVLIGLQSSYVSQLPNPGLALLAVLYVALALWHMLLGAGQAMKYGSVEGSARSWLDVVDFRSYPENHEVRLAFGMLSVLLWAGVFLVANTGLRFYGL